MRIDSRRWTPTYWREGEALQSSMRETKKGNDENGTERFRRSADNLIFGPEHHQPFEKGYGFSRGRVRVFGEVV